MTEERKTYIQYRIDRAKDTLREVDYLINGKFWNLAANRLYYSAFYIIQALLSCINISPKTHKGLQNMFNQHFILTKEFPTEYSELFSKLFDQRQESDYGDNIKLESEDIIPFLKQVNNFIEIISDYICERFMNN